MIVVHLHADDDEATKNDPPVEVYADCHVHLLDFLQNGEFQNADHKFPGGKYGAQSVTGRFASLPFGERGRRIEALLESMGRAKVRHALVMGMPFIKKWSANEPCSSVDPFRLANANVDPVAATEVRVADVPVTLDRSALVRMVRSSVADEIVAFVRSASVRLVSVRSLPVRLLDVPVAPVRSAPVRSALVRLELDRLAPVMVAPAMFAPVSVAETTVALVRSAPASVAPVRVDPDRSAPVRFADRKFNEASALLRSCRPERSSPDRSARSPVAAMVWLVPVRFADWIPLPARMAQ